MATTTQVTPNGFLGIFDAHNCDSSKMQDKSNINKWFKEVIAALDTTAVGTAQIESNGSSHPDMSGFVATQFTESGSVTIQCSNKLQQIYVDIFSYDPFNPEGVESAIKNNFGSGATIQKMAIPRNATA